MQHLTRELTTTKAALEFEKDSHIDTRHSAILYTAEQEHVTRKIRRVPSSLSNCPSAFDRNSCHLLSGTAWPIETNNAIIQKRCAILHIIDSQSAKQWQQYSPWHRHAQPMTF
eukprot:12431468-Karenia_brevis.AAC.2